MTITKQNTRDNSTRPQIVTTLYEVGRTLRILQQYPDKNGQLGGLFRERLCEKLLSLNLLDEIEAETVCFLTSEMRQMSSTLDGQPLRYGSNEYYVKLSA